VMGVEGTKAWVETTREAMIARNFIFVFKD
jgi:hypothetical protein